MKKRNSWLFILPLILCFILTGVYSMLFVWSDDETAPVITVETDEILVSVNASEAELLAGITARDERDGDVTADIVVEKISNIGDDHTATITYAAFDRSGNVAKATRKLRYTDYTEPRFGQTRALVFQEGTSPDVLSYMTATDVVDGDLSRQVKGTLVSSTVSLSYAGLHQIDFRVTNSMGQTVHLILPVEIYDAGSYNATVELEEYLIYLEKGEEFDPLVYLENLTVGNMPYSLKGDDPELRLTANGEVIAGESGTIGIEIAVNDPVDTGVPGVYSVTYTVTMNRYVGYTRLNVVVED